MTSDSVERSDIARGEADTGGRMAVWKRRSRFGITFARMEMGGVDDTAGAALVGD